MIFGNYCTLKRGAIVIVAAIYLRDSFGATWENRLKIDFNLSGKKQDKNTKHDDIYHPLESLSDQIK